MKGRLLLFTGVLLLTLLASLYLPQSVAQGRRSARTRSTVLTAQTIPVTGSIQGTQTLQPNIIQFRGSPTAEQQLLPIVVQDDIRKEDQLLADEIFRLIPSPCISRLHNFYVRYDGSLQSRGLAGEDTIILDGTLPADEKRAVLIHEALGHFMDLGCLRGSSMSGPSAFKDGNVPVQQDDPSVLFYQISWQDQKTKRSDTKAEDCVTRYACSQDPFEDVAESAIYYLLQERDFRNRAKTNPALAKKLSWMETYVFTDKSVVLATSDYKTKGKIAWDATKLPYQWLGMN